MNTEPIYYAQMSSPVGLLVLTGDHNGLREVRFEQEHRSRMLLELCSHGPQHLIEPMRQLEEYFAGTRQSFDLKLNLIGTAFQLDVWHALAEIPYGVTTSYARVSRRIERPRANRAVGAANGLNPIPIILPCHRVIGSNGSLTGFGGGLPAKQWLLAHEARHQRGEARTGPTAAGWV